MSDAPDQAPSVVIALATAGVVDACVGVREVGWARALGDKRESE